MNNPFSRTPFLFFLLALLAGIILQYNSNIHIWSIFFIPFGIIIMLLSFRLNRESSFKFRWLFGVGTVASFVGLGCVSLLLSEEKRDFNFMNDSIVYKAVILDIPQEKPKTFAYRLSLSDHDQQVMAYFQKDTNCVFLNPGDEILFKGKIVPFENSDAVNAFDYAKYMYNQGFSGSVYIARGLWKETGNTERNLKIIALHYRQQILHFYKSLGFNKDEFAILSALTLGYQDVLSDDVKQSFRTTGTVHVLSVSGLHVGIIYVMISFILGFIRRNSKYYWLKPCIIIILLWIYSFLTGLPPSVIRASAMLTVFCLSELFNRKNNSINGLYIAAFFILLVSPFSLFDIGFQLSFVSVLFVLYLYPKLSRALPIKNKYIRSLWQLLALSFAAQLGTFPICLYYFGTFPTYFFISNLFIVPLVSLITYSFGGIILAKLLSLVIPIADYYIYYLPVNLLKILVDVMMSVLHFFERLPYALIDKMYISAIELIFIFGIIFGFLFFLMRKEPKGLMASSLMVVFLLSFNIYNNLRERYDTLLVLKHRGFTEIGWNTSRDYTPILRCDTIIAFKELFVGDKKILVLAEKFGIEKINKGQPYHVDYLILTSDNNNSIKSLLDVIAPQNIIICSSVSNRTAYNLSKECQKLNIPCNKVILRKSIILYYYP